MSTISVALRVAGADQTRPYATALDAVNRAIGQAADAVGRWSWVRDYERTERLYWPADKGAV